MRRTAGIHAIWMAPTEKGLEFVLQIAQSSEPAVLDSELPTTVVVLVDGKLVHRSIVAGPMILRIADAFGVNNLEMAQAKSLEIRFSLDQTDHKGKEQTALSCRLEGSMETMQQLMRDHQELASQQRQYQAEFDALLLFWSVATLALGGIILLVVLVESRKIFAFSGAIGAIAAIILEPVLTPGIIPPPYALLFKVGLGACAAMIAAMIVGLLLAEAVPSLHAQLRENLDPSRWKCGPESAEVAMKDQVRRWFVTIGSATGALVGTTLGLDVFRAAFTASLEPRYILIAVVLVAVGFFFSGPIQAYVLDWGTGAKEPSDPSKRLADILAAGDWRSIGRFALVALAYLQIWLVSSSFGTTVKQGNSQVLATLALAVVTPAIVSYYWSAALQRSAPSVLHAVAWPSVWAGAIMAYGSALVLVFNLFDANDAFVPKSQGDRGPVFVFIAVPAFAVLVALLQSAITTLPFAAAGGYAIDRLPGRHVMLYVGAALAGVAIVIGAVQILIQSAFGIDASKAYLPFLLGILGWTVGLWASGFPRLVMKSRPAPARENQ